MTMTSDMAIFNAIVQDVAVEAIAQQVDLFNQKTRGAITMTTKRNAGEYNKSMFYPVIADIDRERDPDSEAAVSPLTMTRSETGGVKVTRGLGPAYLPAHVLRIMQRDPNEAAVVWGRQLAAARMQKMLNLGLASFVAATLTNSALVNDTSAVPSASGMSNAQAKMGDARTDLVAWVMHSSTANLVYTGALANSASLFKFETARMAFLQDPFGNPIIITDSTALVSSADYYALCLKPGAIQIEDNDDLVTVTNNVLGQQNIRVETQGEYSFNLSLLGYNWDETNGGHFPAEATLAVGTNWDQSATSDKDCGGVIYTSHLT